MFYFTFNFYICKCIHLCTFLLVGMGSLDITFVNHTDNKIYKVITIKGSQGNNWYPVKRLVQDLPQTYKVIQISFYYFINCIVNAKTVNVSFLNL